MIVVDTSALIAITLNESEAARCSKALAEPRRRLVSAATLAEAYVVADARDVGAAVRRLVREFDMEIVPLTAEGASLAAAAYARFGKSYHPARLNFADCFAYALARERGCPLLFVGNDFAQTDIVAA